MRTKTIFATFFFVMALFVGAIQEADAAKRFGGGRSFGSKPSMQRSTTAPQQQQPGVTQNATKTQSTKKSGMAGIFGGLLAGTLLGSLLFGDGDGGGIFSILIIGLLLFVAYKVFMRMRRGSMQSAGGGAQYASASGPVPPQGGMHYQSAQEQGGSWGSLQGGAQQNPQIPAGFKVEEFLEGAKMAFSRLQKSWDNRDLDDIALFTSPTVLEEVKKQLAEDTTPTKTEVLLNNARLLSVNVENGEEIATVYFDVIMRESTATSTTQVREVWHFVRAAQGGNWKLDGIQQIEE